jgi:hypothetical protein
MRHSEHVLEDLLPYVCIVHDCQRSTEPFKTRTLWLNHLKAKHGLDLAKPELACDLCAEIVTGDQKARVAHTENHLIEIALSVLPASGDHDADEFNETGAVTRPDLSTSEHGRGRNPSGPGVTLLDRWFAGISRAGSETTDYGGLRKSDVQVRGQEIEQAKVDPWTLTKGSGHVTYLYPIPQPVSFPHPLNSTS